MNNNNNQTNTHYYMFLILKKLLNSTVKYNNTKCQPLIPIGIIKKCKEIKQYLLELHPSITIDLWIHKDIELQKAGDMLANETCKTRTGRGKNVIIQLLSQLDILLTEYPKQSEQQQQRQQQQPSSQQLNTTLHSILNNNNSNNDKMILMIIMIIIHQTIIIM